ncbi:hypothetical protein H6G27_15210 [Nostoc linckia FACHB-104]|nr:hypothetical protein [Nostoc linckia FACHB-104]
MDLLKILRSKSEYNSIIDLAIFDKNSRVLIELKRSGRPIISKVLAQVRNLMLKTSIDNAIIYLFSDTGGELDIQEHSFSDPDSKVLILKSQE